MMHACLLCMYTADIKLKSWLKEIVGTTVMRSSVLNFHQPKKPLPKKGIYNFFLLALLYQRLSLFYACVHSVRQCDEALFLCSDRYNILGEEFGRVNAVGEEVPWLSCQ